MHCVPPHGFQTIETMGPKIWNFPRRRKRVKLVIGRVGILSPRRFHLTPGERFHTVLTVCQTTLQERLELRKLAVRDVRNLL